jgi:hypothetical protein
MLSDAVLQAFAVEAALDAFQHKVLTFDEMREAVMCIVHEMQEELDSEKREIVTEETSL